MFQPRFKLTPRIVRSLMAIEADRQVVGRLPLTARVLNSLRQTARLLSTHLSTQIEENRLTQVEVRQAIAVHRSGYGSNGMYSLEEYYAANLEGYYGGLSVGKSHNYDFGRVEADVTRFVDYFCAGMAEAFGKVRARTEEAGRRGARDQSAALRALSPQQRRALGLFTRRRVITARDLAAYFKCSSRSAPATCRKWVDAGFLVIEDPSKRGAAIAWPIPTRSSLRGRPGRRGVDECCRARRRQAGWTKVVITRRGFEFL